MRTNSYLSRPDKMAEHFNNLLDRQTEQNQEKQVQKEERHD
jgi:hypothetical protein